MGSVPVIKLLHIADVHLGKTFRMLGRKGAIQRKTQQATFERAIGLALEHRVHAVLLAGDLFDTPKPSDTLVRSVVQQLRRLDAASIVTFLVAGNHDLGPDGRVGAVAGLEDAGSGLRLIGQDTEVHRFEELDLTVIARSATPAASHSPLSGWPIGRTTRYAVGVAHGSTYRSGQVEDPHAIHPREIRELGLDYLALGDWHSAFEAHPAPTVAWYAGAPEWLAFDQPGSGHVLLVEISAPGEAKVMPLPVGRRRSLRQEYNAAEVDEAALRTALKAAADPELVCEVMLTGLMPLHRAINVDALEEDFGDAFFRLRITNRARIWLDKSALEAIPAQTVLGRFVRLMSERITQASENDQSILEEALQVGAAVLAGRADEVLG